MSKIYWEDFVAGSVTEYGPRLVTREEIIAFATEFDPQPMHLDETAGRASMLDGLAASGWHSCCILMRLMVDSLLIHSSSMGSPGLEEVRWLRPVRPGDSLTLRTEIRETRASRSKPDVGLVTFGFELRNQKAETATTLVTTILFGRKPTGAEAGRA